MRTEELSPKKLALLARLLQKEGVDSSRFPLGPVARHAGPLPLSFAQEQLWTVHYLDPDSPAYNVHLSVPLPVAAERGAVERALREVVARHEILRTVFPAVDGRAVQVVTDSSGPDLAHVDLCSLGTGERKEAFDRVSREAARRPFDLATGPLLRAVLVTLPDAPVLLLTLHHIVTDGWSTGVLVQELREAVVAFTEGRTPSLRPLPVQYADYAAWQRAWLSESQLAASLDYWKARLAGAAPLQLPPDRRRPAVPSFEGAVESLVLRGELLDALRRSARAAGVSLFTALVAAFKALLQASTGQHDVVIGIPVANRERAEVQPLIGFFVNMLALRTRVDPRATFMDLLADVHQVASDAFAHQDVPFERVASALGAEKDLSRSPVFQVVFNYLDQRTATGDAAEAVGEIGSAVQTIRFDLEAHVLEMPDALRIGFAYSTDLFEAASVRNLLTRYVRVLERAAAAPTTPLASLTAAGDDDLALVVREWNTTTRAYPQLSLPQLFERQVEMRPDAVALEWRDVTVSYAELNRQANRVANALRNAGSCREHRIGVSLDRGIDQIVAILGILKAGAAYVALDPGEPFARTSMLLADAGVSLVIVGDARGPAAFAGQRTVRFGDLTGPESNPDLGTSPEALAYVAFTSGSTGRPKGVEVPHRAVVRLLFGADYVRLGPDETILQLAPVNFDASTLEIWGALLHGSRLVIYPERVPEPVELGEVLQRSGVTTMWLTASLFNAVIDQAPRALSGLRQLLIGGEALSVPHVERALSLLPATTLINGYGPTENTTFTCCYTIPRTLPPDAVSVPLGSPIANTRAYVLDGELQPVPVGVPGELFVGGDGLARGYAAAPRLTAERFVADPISGEYGARLYRTGDLVRWCHDGTLEFLGRRDEQIKLRGYRIELGEVEAALAQAPGVASAAASVRVAGTDRRLVGYVVRDPAASAVDTAAIRAFVQQVLPAYMVPAAIVVLEALPLTQSGKIDRRALPEPVIPAGAADARVAPRSPVEETLAAIWADTLRLPSVGVHDNFFELGGDSILSIQIASKAVDAGLALKPRHVFQHATIAELAIVVAGATAVAHEQPDGHGDVPLTPVQRWFLDSDPVDAHHFNQALMVTTPQDTDVALLRRALDRLVAHHDVLRARFTRANGTWSQSVPQTVAAAAFDVVDLAAVAPDAQRDAMLHHCLSIQASLSLENGAVFRAVLFERGSVSPRRLFLVAHHLVVDAVSWRVLLNDLRRLYAGFAEGGEVSLRKTTPFRTWAATLAARAERLTALEREYWIDEAERARAATVPAGAGEASETGMVRTVLTERETAALLREAPRALDAHIDELLLAGVALGCRRGRGDAMLRVDVEGHGRSEALQEEARLDLSRTVGWFTTIFPIQIELAAEADAGTSLAVVKRVIRDVPGEGLGYGLLRYLGAPDIRRRLEAAGDPAVSFNYLGQFDSLQRDGDAFAPSGEPTGAAQSPRMRRRHALDIVAVVSGGRLQIDWSYDGAVYDAAITRTIADETTAALRALVAAAAAGAAVSGAATAAPSTHAALLARYPGAEDAYPVTPMQHGMLFHTLLHPDDGIYNELFTCRFEGDLDVAAFQAAWARIVERHGVLRSVFAWEGVATPVQVVRREHDPHWVLHDWRDLPEDEQQLAVARLQADEARRGFDLANGPLLRFTLARLGDTATQFVWAFHHVLLDGWSLAIVSRELGELYEALVHGREPRLEPAAPYSGYVKWRERQHPDASEAYWRQTLGDVIAPTPLGVDRPGLRPDRPVGAAEHTIELSADTTAVLLSDARRKHLTLNTLLVGAWSVVLSRYSGQDDVLFGMTVSGRPADLAGSGGTVGLFINTVPVRVRVPREAMVTEWLRDLQAGQAEQQEHDYLSLIDVARCSGVPQETRLFESILVFENYPVDRSRDGAASTLRVIAPEARHRSNYPLVLVASAGGPRLLLRAIYDESRFETDTIARLLSHVTTVLIELSKGPTALRDVEMFDRTDRHRLLHAWNPSAPAARGLARANLVSWFEHQVAAQPTAVAVTAPDRTLTYAALNSRANRLAAYLRTLGVGPEVPVGLCVERSADLVVGVLAILKAGGAYVPVDPSYPDERMHFILGDARVPVVVTETSLQHRVTGSSRVAVCLDASEQELRPHDEGNVPVTVDAASRAYVIYTSGSTGQPKGVEVSHGEVMRLFERTADWFEFGASDVWTLFHSIAFDFSVWELWGALLYGGRLVVVPYWVARSPEAFRGLLSDEHVTVLNQTPSAFRQLIDADARPDAPALSLRHVVFGGEALDPRSLRPWVERHGIEAPRLVNMYGITETTVHVTYRPLTLKDVTEGSGSVIGEPIADLAVYLLDREFEPAALGAAGEMFVGGAGVARGYLHRPRLTAERFVPDPFGSIPGARLYRSGDLARRLPNGDLEYLGRIDHQVKIRGFRIELGEIEDAVRQHPAVRESVVLPVAGEDDTRLVAYVVPDADHAAPLRRLIEWERDGRLANRSWCELPNGAAVVQLNRNETEFLYGEIFTGERYFRHGVALQPGACVFDVGANIGMFTLYVAQECPEARIFAFEPIPPVCEILELNARLHGVNATTRACGLSDETGEATFTYYPNVSIFSGRFGDLAQERAVVEAFVRNQSGDAAPQELIDELLRDRLTSREVQCPLTTVSAVIAAEGIDRIDLLKVDVEKSELAVLQGVATADWPKVRQVIVEVHDQSGRLAAVTSLLERHGFNVTVDQDADLEGTGLYSVFGVRQVAPATEAAAVRRQWSSPARLTGELRQQLARTLPDYMVPSAFIVVNELPLTANGKLDRRALPVAAASRRARMEPRTPTEERVAALYGEVLGQRSVAADDDFFGLGGHSLLATRAVARLRDTFGIDLPLVLLFDKPTVADLSSEIDRRLAAGAGTDEPRLERVPRDRPLPLSSAQQRLWFLDQLEPGQPTYNVPGALRLAGALDVRAMEDAFTEIVRRHEVLRTTFTTVDGTPVQVIGEPRRFTFARVEIRGLAPADQDAEVARVMAAESLTPFDLARGPLVRGRLLVLGSECHILLLTLHHVVCDAWSLRVLVRELVELYDGLTTGRQVALDTLDVQYADFAAWQRRWLEGPALGRQLDYWERQLSGAPTLQLPTDRPRPVRQTSSGSYVKRQLPLAVSRAVEQLAQQEKATLFATTLTAFDILLSRYSGQSDVVVGVPVAHRPHKELEPLIGFFSNTLVMRSQLAGTESFRENLRRVRATTHAAYEHQDVPFELLVERLQPERHLDRHPLFQVVFTVLHGAEAPLRLAGLTAEALDPEQLSARFDLEVHVAETDNGLLTAFYFNSDLFDDETIARMAAQFEAVLEAAVTHPDRPIDQLAIVPAAEAVRLEQWNATSRPVPLAPLASLVEEQVARTPAATAVEFGTEQLTYVAFNARANQLAHYLRSRGVGPDAPVAIAMDRSVDLAVAVLAVIKAGGAYLPLDIAYPKDRLLYMLRDSGARVLLTHNRLASGFAEEAATSACTVLRLDGERAIVAAFAESNPAPLSGVDNLGYVLYTSGSTGRPKGVALGQRALVNLLSWQIEVSRGRAAGRTLQYAPLSFDPSFLEMFSAWCAGGTLVLVEEDRRRDFLALVRYLAEQEIERLYITPAALHQLADASESCGIVPASLREINAAGERLELTPQIRRMCESIDGCVLFNQYGPTETHVVTAETLSGPAALWPADPTIGRALPNTRLHVLDGNGHPTPIGVPGELFVAGDCLARGYIGNPRLTAERFTPDAHAGSVGGRLYRTGDLVRYRADGSVDYLGRTDDQVKLRGYRIELGEIESVLGQHPDVFAAVAAVRESASGSRHLIGYAVPRDGVTVSGEDVRAHAARLLPEYMVPAAIELLPALPLTPSGKVDRKALPALDFEDASGAYVAPRNPIEERVAAIWAESLGLPRIGVLDNFFAAGGHSLLAAQVISRVRREWGLELPIRLLFESPTVAALAERLEALLLVVHTHGVHSADAAVAGEREEGAL